MRERYLIIMAIAAYSILEVWTIVPSGRLIKPFPFSGQEIYFQTYVWFACLKVALMVFCYILTQYAGSEYFKLFVVLFWSAVAEFIEYFLNYNEPWFRVMMIPVDVTTIRYTASLLMAYKIWKKNL